MGKRNKDRGHFNKPVLFNLIVGGIVGCFISFALTPSLKNVFGIVEEKLGPVIFTISTLSFGAIVYAALQVIHYRRVAKSTRRTVVHYLKVFKSVTPLAPIIISLQLLFLGALVFLGAQQDVPKEDLKEVVCLVFFCIAMPLGLLGWILIGTWYQRWLLKRSKTVVESLMDKKSGFVEYSTSDDKDEVICKILYSLENCHFIFVWAIHFSDVIGQGNPDALDKIFELFRNNPELKLLVLLQCPFCEDVIERAIELDIPYGPEYIAASIESISNCLAFGLAFNFSVRVALAHREPYIRSILWGRFKENCPFGPLALAEAPLEQEKEQINSCLRYMTYVEWGGFTLQQYCHGEDGCYAPLYKGSTLAHGGHWNRIRYKFAIEFLKGIKPNKPLRDANKITLEHLAQDFGMRKRKAKKSSKAELYAFIEEIPQYADFIQRIHDQAITNANILRMKAEQEGFELPMKIKGLEPMFGFHRKKVAEKESSNNKSTK